jgi:protein ImuA
MPDAAHLLTRTSHRRPDLPELHVLEGMTLARARVHEFCGPARRRLAAKAAGALQGPVFWIRPAWEPEGLDPGVLAGFAEPSRFLFCTPKRAEDLLWTMEEILRSGLAPLAVVDLPGPPGLTAVRRLHLAAETGAAEGKVVPLGLILTPGAGGAPGVESRWSLTPAHADGKAAAWSLARLRARMAPEARWRIEGEDMRPARDVTEPERSARCSPP